MVGVLAQISRHADLSSKPPAGQASDAFETHHEAKETDENVISGCFGRFRTARMKFGMMYWVLTIYCVHAP